MADETGKEQTATTWPIGKFAFNVKIGSAEILFQEITGLDTEVQMEYRAGSSKVFAPVKMPGITKYGNITLRKGIFKNDNQLWEMYSLVKANNFNKTTVTISLLDETSNTAMSWELTNAFPSKMTVNDIKSDNNQPIVETIELMHEGLSIR